MFGHNWLEDEREVGPFSHWLEEDYAIVPRSIREDLDTKKKKKKKIKSWK